MLQLSLLSQILTSALSTLVDLTTTSILSPSYDLANIENLSTTLSSLDTMPDNKDYWVGIVRSSSPRPPIFRISGCRDFSGGPSYVKQLKAWSSYLRIADDGGNSEPDSKLWYRLAWDPEQVANI